ncbi:MAG TPA: hypothetical protein P5557_08275 [Candidatus Sumerlaeia bacterium]|nr:MAG: hypothetical protein BWY90_00040 [Deltaproteobacteria bacterium ADurb.BinA014]HOR65883.1 hypothetical protein [Candidatus Sumerlaeota bacterium]HRR31286.1 hypothetical protein [Candidatus Sumerlaeia bacterium]
MRSIKKGGTMTHDYFIILDGHEEHPIPITRKQARAHWARYNSAPMPKGEIKIERMAARLIPAKLYFKEATK